MPNLIRKWKLKEIVKIRFSFEKLQFYVLKTQNNKWCKWIRNNGKTLQLAEKERLKGSWQKCSIFNEKEEEKLSL